MQDLNEHKVFYGMNDVFRSIDNATNLFDKKERKMIKFKYCRGEFRYVGISYLGSICNDDIVQFIFETEEDEISFASNLTIELATAFSYSTEFKFTMNVRNIPEIVNKFKHNYIISNDFLNVSRKISEAIEFLANNNLSHAIEMVATMNDISIREAGDYIMSRR